VRGATENFHHAAVVWADPRHALREALRDAAPPSILGFDRLPYAPRNHARGAGPIRRAAVEGVAQTRGRTDGGRAMSKGVSSIYSRGALYMSKPIWSPDPAKKKKKRKTAPLGGKKMLKRSPDRKLHEQRVLLDRQALKLRSTSAKREAIWLRSQSSLTTNAVTVPGLRRKHEALLGREARQKAAILQTMQAIRRLEAESGTPRR
jgi:hypothetical protein